LVLVLDELAAAGCGRRARVDRRAGLDRGLGVGADHAVAGLKQLAFPAALIEVEEWAGLLQEVGARGKIHERCWQGLIASSTSQRPIVDADARLMPARRRSDAAQSG
jgi:hypothetical protein